MRDQGTPDDQRSANAAVRRHTAPQLLGEIASLKLRLAQVQGELDDVRASRSWRWTRPLRWLNEQRQALHAQGLRERVRRLLAKVARRTRRLYRRHTGQTAPERLPGREAMSVPACLVYERMQRAIATRSMKER